MRTFIKAKTHFNITHITYCETQSLTQITLDGDFADFYTFGKTNNQFLWEHACRRPKCFGTSVERTGQNPQPQLSLYNHLQLNLSQKNMERRGRRKAEGKRGRKGREKKRGGRGRRRKTGGQ